MEIISTLAAPVVALSVELTALGPVLWGMTALVALCVGVLGYDALHGSSLATVAPARPAPFAHGGHLSLGEFKHAA